MKVSRRSFVAAAVCAGTACAVAASGCAQSPVGKTGVPPDTQPMWLVRKGASKVYIYGDFGSLTPKWSAPRVEAAFAEAKVFWKETGDLKPGDEQMFIAAGRGGDRPLSTWLTPDQKMKVAAAAVDAGTTYAALEPLKPWLAAISINRSFNSRSTQKPVDDPIPILTARAVARGIPIRAEIPDADGQLELVRSMSDVTQVEYLLYTIENNQLPQDVIDARRRAWAAGDLHLEVRQVLHFKADFPNLYVPFEMQRNRAWPARIRQMLDEGGTAFVLVGADHLVGPDSLPMQLDRAGLAAKRV
jgi:uncharacterized protein YbaP (TraB family)